MSLKDSDDNCLNITYRRKSPNMRNEMRKVLSMPMSTCRSVSIAAFVPWLIKKLTTRILFMNADVIGDFVDQHGNSQWRNKVPRLPDLPG